jgi:AraC-like DNA-binding protein
VGLSERRFIDLFRAEVGLTPKLFSRIRRFHRTLQSADAEASPGWAELATACGYFDQSHLIRDFHQFAALTPADYAARLNALRARGAYTKRNHLPLAD